MTISMEKIDELRKRTNCSYEEARNLLEKHNGDILDAILELEKQHRCYDSDSKNEGFGTRLKRLFRKGFNTRFIVENKDDTIINLSINFMILLAVISSHILIIGLILALIMGYKIRIRKLKGSDINVDKIFKDVGEKVKKSVVDYTNDDEKAEKKDDYNEVTIE